MHMVGKVPLRFLLTFIRLSDQMDRSVVAV